MSTGQVALLVMLAVVAAVAVALHRRGATGTVVLFAMLVAAGLLVALVMTGVGAAGG